MVKIMNEKKSDIKISFNQNEKMRLGVEIELQMIDPETGNLKPCGLEVLEKIKNENSDDRIKPEIFQSMLEIDTPICDNAHDAGQSMRKSLDILRRGAASLNAEVMMSGTHPFAEYTERLLTPKSRYYSLVDRNQWIARRLQIFGLHVHVGMKNGEHAIAVSNCLSHYLPLVLALSASSPYWRSEDTGLASCRVTFFEAIPTGGHPYLIPTWNDFEILVDKMIRSKSITSLKDLWWDIRPNPEYGTIEVRIADCPPTIKEVECLVALIHTLSVMIDRDLSAGRKFSPPPEWILRENKWRASRHGIDCDLISNDEAVSLPLQKIWADLKLSLKNIIEEFSYQEHFQFMTTLIEKGTSSVRQRKAFQNGGMKNVISHLIDENTKDECLW